MTAAVSPGIRLRHRRLGRSGYLVLLWAIWFGLTLAFEFVRGIGDEVSPAHRVASIERAVFLGAVPSEKLQAWLFARDLPWLDYFAFLMHGLWFGVPFAFGLVVMIYRRQALLEFFSWMLTTTYLAGMFYLLFPVEPPWLQLGVPRILYVRNFGDYPANIDPNPLAAFPSLHAAIPMVVGLFFLLRGGPKMAFFGKVSIVYALAVGFSIVYMGEHWAIDVFAGYLLAGAVAAAFMSRRVRSLVTAIPGDPIGALVRFDASVWAQPVAAVASGPREEPLRRAA